MTDLGDISLIYVRLRDHTREIGDGHQHRPGIVHGPGDHILALLDIYARYHTGDGRTKHSL